MAQHSNGNNTAKNQFVKHVFHDFLGPKPTDSPFVLPHKTADVRHSVASPSLTSVSIGASSGGTRGPFSTASDIGSERQIENHPEKVTLYASRSDFSGTEISNRLVGNKRSNLDSTFMGSSRDAFQMVPNSLQNSHMMKILRNVPGGERHRRPNDDEVFRGMQSLKPTSASQIFQPPTSTRIDANKWEQSILMNAGPSIGSMQLPLHGAQLSPYVHQKSSNIMRDANAAPSFISQSAADEGSRTGIKGPGILSSMNTTTASEKTPSPVRLGGGKPMPLTNLVDPESSVPPSQHGPTSASRQMTIFYGGQAHVFDDVHPHKADIIMALAGSNGGSWSTTFSPKSAVKTVKDNNLLSGEHETGAHRGSIVAKKTRNLVQAADPSSEGKRAE